MDLKAEKRTLVALAAAALLIVILLPLLFRELEPDYDAAYSLDPARKSRFASKDDKAPELPHLPPSAAETASSSTGAGPGPRLEVSAHKALPPAGSVSAPPPVEKEAQERAEPSGPAAVSAAKLVPVRGPAAGGEAAAPGRRFPKLDESRLAQLDDAPGPRAGAGPGAAQAAHLAQSMGLGDVPALLEAGEEVRSNECAETAGRLKSRLRAATVAAKAADDEMVGARCSKEDCGRHADDCAEKERSPDEARAAARRCRCDGLACKRRETCRVVDELTCRQEAACGGDPSRCASRCE